MDQTSRTKIILVAPPLLMLYLIVDKVTILNIYPLYSQNSSLLESKNRYNKTPHTLCSVGLTLYHN